MEKDHSDNRDLRALVEERIVGGLAASPPSPIFRSWPLNRKHSSIQRQIDLQVESFLCLKLTIKQITCTQSGRFLHTLDRNLGRLGFDPKSVSTLSLILNVWFVPE